MKAATYTLKLCAELPSKHLAIIFVSPINYRGKSIEFRCHRESYYVSYFDLWSIQASNISYINKVMIY